MQQLIKMLQSTNQNYNPGHNFSACPASNNYQVSTQNTTTWYSQCVYIYWPRWNGIYKDAI